MNKTVSEVHIDGKRIKVTNLDKVLYPAVGFTKGQVLDYYLRIAPIILPHMKDRPLTLKRYPSGVRGAPSSRRSMGLGAAVGGATTRGFADGSSISTAFASRSASSTSARRCSPSAFSTAITCAPGSIGSCCSSTSNTSRPACPARPGFASIRRRTGRPGWR